MYTIDTNILIYHANGDAAVGRFLVMQLEKDVSLFLPTIAVAEFFSFPAITQEARSVFESALPYFRIVSLDYALALISAELGRDYHLKLGDSVIAATALHTYSTLVTRNVRDFKKISELNILTI